VYALQKTDFKFIAETRRINFNLIYSLLSDFGLLGNEVKCPEFKIANVMSPMFLPIRLENDITQLKNYLNSQGIYAPIHWPVLHNLNSVGWRRNTTIKNMISLPIDQRINIEQIEKIVKSLFEFVRNRI
jgi:dTDP-4-amino-4,6-dideoxygalactose transaminase